jgi:hypothetical protein
MLSFVKGDRARPIRCYPEPRQGREAIAGHVTFVTGRGVGIRRAAAPAAAAVAAVSASPAAAAAAGSTAATCPGDLPAD